MPPDSQHSHIWDDDTFNEHKEYANGKNRVKMIKIQEKTRT